MDTEINWQTRFNEQKFGEKNLILIMSILQRVSILQNMVIIESVDAEHDLASFMNELSLVDS